MLLAVLRDRGDVVIGYTDRTDQGMILGVRFLGTDDALDVIHRDDPACCAALGVGMVEVDPRRRELLESVAARGLPMPAVVARRATVHEDVEFGDATVVFSGAVVNPGVRTGAGCILNSNCTVEHDCRLGRNVHVAPGATLSGGVTMGDDVLVGTGANVIQGVRIVGGVTVGAGATVVGDLTVPGVYVGVPARPIA